MLLWTAGAVLFCVLVFTAYCILSVSKDND